jgi:hypothetical protein
MAQLLGHRQTKETVNRQAKPTATAPHPDSTGELAAAHHEANLYAGLGHTRTDGSAKRLCARLDLAVTISLSDRSNRDGCADREVGTTPFAL